MRSSNSAAPLRTKLVATIGPASAAPERLHELLAAGVDVCRINFSHGTLDEHAGVLRCIREWSLRHAAPIALLGDLCGPKIRLREVPGGPAELRTGQTAQIARGAGACEPPRLTVSYERFVDEVDVGERVYIDDGLVRLLVLDKSADAVTCVVKHGGAISTRKGVNLPDSRLSAAALTDKDQADLRWALEHELDYVALSFVRRPGDLARLHELIAEHAHRPGVIVKIEMAEALQHLDALIRAADGVMIARGDLGVEMDVWQVPLTQKAITARARQLGRPAIVATQMLQSMVTSPSPTRAEVSDVANAILDTADAVMLSAESAAGQFPLAAVEMMGRVAAATEAFQGYDRVLAEAPTRGDACDPRVSAIAHAAVQAALELGARLVAVWTMTGETARQIARHRLPLPVAAFTSDERVWRRLSLFFGVVPLLIAPLGHPAEMSAAMDAALLQRGLVRRGDLIVVVSSSAPARPGTSDTVVVHEVGTK